MQNSPLLRPKSVLDAVAAVVLFIAVVALCVLVITVSWQVIARYIPFAKSAGTVDLAEIAFVWLTVMAIALSVRKGRHLVVALWDHVPRLGIKVGLEIFATVVVSIVSGVMVWSGIAALPVVFTRTMPTLGISAGWMYLAIPVGFAITLIFAVEACWHSVAKWRNRAGAAHSDAARAEGRQ